MDTIKKKFLEVLELSHGIVVTACKSVDISRQTYYNWLKNDEDFKDEVDIIQDVAIDFVESKLIEKINGITVMTHDSKGMPVIYEQPPSDTAVIFFLKTRGKKRGYVERMEFDTGNSFPLLLNNPLNDPATDDSTTEDNGS